jgi:hypothetical protein
MKLTYKVSKNNQEVIELSKIALRHKLFVPGWMLQGILSDKVHFIDTKSKAGIKQIAIAYVLKVPIAVAIVEPNNQVMIFVRLIMRKKGIGTKLLSKLDLPKHPRFLDGVDGSHIFYRKAMKSIKGVK